MSLPADIRPTAQMVADLVRTRLVEESGEMIDGSTGTGVDTFTDATYPTITQVERLIDQAVLGTLGQIPGSIVENMTESVSHLAALYAAILVEGSYFREQLTDDQVDLYLQLLRSGFRGVGATAEGGAEVPGGGPGPVDSVITPGVFDEPYLWVIGNGTP